MKTNSPQSFVVAETPTVLLAQPSNTSNWPLFPVGATFLVTTLLTGAIASLYFKKDRLFQWLGTFAEVEEISSQEFAIDIEALNVRTQDCFRANVKATVFVSIQDDNKSKQNAKKFLVEEGSISLIAVEKAVKKRAEAAIRGSVANQKTLNDLHVNRVTVGQDAQKNLDGRSLNFLGLVCTGIIISEIEESTSYSENNYFDAQALKARTEAIQDAILKTRTKELEVEEKIKEKELDSEKLIREKVLNIGKEIRAHELKIGIELEELEVNNQETSLGNLKKVQEIGKKKIDHELFMEQYQNEKQKELEKQIETSELALRKDLEFLRTKTETDIQLAKILQETDLIEKDKAFKIKQTQIHQEIETQEIATTISILGEEEKRLIKEKSRAEAEDALTAAIEEAKALRQQKQVEIAAASVEDEAKTIERLAEAEGKRYREIPATDADRTAQMIRELAPLLMENLPQFVEIANALAPKPGVLGDSNIYTFPHGNGEDMNKLVLSTSAVVLLQSLFDGKLGNFLNKSLRSLNNGNEGD